MADVIHDQVGSPPNTPEAIGQGVSQLAPASCSDRSASSQSQSAFTGAGAPHEIEEKLMDPACRRSGPAFAPSDD